MAHTNHIATLLAAAGVFFAQDASAAIYPCDAAHFGTNCAKVLIPAAGGTLTSTLVVAPSAACPSTKLVTDVNVRLALRHGFVGDMTATLVHPDGRTSANLILRPGR